LKWLGFSGRTLWDWLQLLIIPVVITGGTLWFSAQQSQASSQASERQHQTDLQLANDQQQESALQTYLDRMSDLLLNNKLSESQPGYEVRNVARARTLTVLPQLNGIRKGELVQFLYEAKLIGGIQNPQTNSLHYLPIIDLDDADLSGASLFSADLHGVVMSFTNLQGANLSNAILSGASLYCADLRSADLKGTSLDSATLINAKVTKDQLKQAKSLKDATLPKYQRLAC
jgi:uncharacterized protein YjbI with pentapeptide repeats